MITLPFPNSFYTYNPKISLDNILLYHTVGMFSHILKYYISFKEIKKKEESEKGCIDLEDAV